MHRIFQEMLLGGLMFEAPGEDAKEAVWVWQDTFTSGSAKKPGYNFIEKNLLLSSVFVVQSSFVPKLPLI